MDNILLNRYEIIKHLGTGGFGETYLAKDLHSPTQKRVVVKSLKQIHDKSRSEFIEKLFLKEASTLEELGENCKQIPTLHAYFHHQDRYYLVQEYIEGKSLHKLGIISADKCKEILLSFLEVLKYIHSENIIHRDIKPDNIIIREKDNLPVLIDFGAVKEKMGSFTTEDGSVLSSVIVGTRGFMAPEQSMGRTVFSSDLFALGLTMIYCLTGKSPMEFPSDTITGELQWQDFVPNLEPRFKEILEKATKMDIPSRYNSAEEMYQDLSAIMGGMLMVSPPLVTPMVETTRLSSPQNTDLKTEVITPVASYEEESNSSAFLMGILGAVVIFLALIAGFFVAQPRQDSQVIVKETEEEETSSIDRENEENININPVEEETPPINSNPIRQEIPEEENIGEIESPPDNNPPPVEETPPEENNPTPPVEENPPIDNTPVLSEQEAIQTVQSLYSYLSSRQFESAIALYSPSMQSQFSQSFFEQFDRVTVEDITITSQSPQSITLVGYNTYYYPDGKTQKEQRNYTITNINGVPQISSSQFLRVTKPKS
ncbi:serine/threonine protein kinase [Cyanobacterium stanieri LEGE 03274]|uniref:non-specific serine/threonine protein kinase n=1 Tax=Cyanobacterium stanieri LEGE 03274 TaxID=1828756 RepID=A0ABR9V496_9CHRO|nr:serine/threonine-protein kinase [Cyanobacterium stanieri]MBE9222715.1 serine/threonine protein kinase [Cyanobacterium stanieri LEGE 03274]